MNDFAPLGGVWWRADDPSRKLAGSLHRDNGWWRLELVGELTYQRSATYGYAMELPPVLHGAAHGRVFTLRHTRFLGSRGPTWPPAVYDGADLIEELQSTQTWGAFDLLESIHATESTLYQFASFSLSGLEWFWQYSGIRGRFNVDSKNEYVTPTKTEVSVREGYRVSVEALTTSRRGLRSSGFEERVVVRVSKDGGFTIVDLEEKVIGPLRALLTICLGQRVDSFGLEIFPLDEMLANPRSTVTVNPNITPASSVWQRNPQFEVFTSASPQVDVATLISRWIDLTAEISSPAYVLENRQPSELQQSVVHVVNAAEALHHYLHSSEDENKDTAEKVRNLLAEHNMFNSKKRRDIRDTLIRRIKLEDRLRALVYECGDEHFASWLVNGDADQWAYVAAKARNVLAHGLHTDLGLETDFAAQTAVLETTRVVLMARLLTLCGVPADSGLFARDGRFLAVLHQQLAEWRELATKLGRQEE